MKRNYPAIWLRCAVILGVCFRGALSLHAETPDFPRLLNSLIARPIGPANMGGRIVDMAIVPNNPRLMYIATASGGLWKTTNYGTQWTPVFDHQSTVSLGAVAIAASNPAIVWAGTGEANARNSVSWGDGVYRSRDGGQTWQCMGLKDSRHIGRIIIHPKNPDIVYVAALGHLWGTNQERGLYRTTDGGQTWKQILFIDQHTGFIDLAMDPSDPQILFAAAYRVRRNAFSGGDPEEQYGKHSGLYKTSDGGQTWNKLTGGLPDCPIGRCGIDIYRKDPRVVYAVVQTDKTLLQRSSEQGQSAKSNGLPDTGGVFRSEDKGQTWVKVNDLCPRPFYFSQIRVDPNNDQRIYVLGISLHVSDDGGKTFRGDGAPGVHADHHALWINPSDSRDLVLGTDGGLYLSHDRGANWEMMQNLPLGQFYAVAVDMRRPYWIYGGLQDNGTWGGPSATRSAEGITLADWSRILGADGFRCQVDPTNPDIVYGEGQYGMLQRLNVRTGARSRIRPRTSQGTPAYRFNWNSPLVLSPHNPYTLYYGGNYVFRSVNRGDVWEIISPDLTRGKPGPSRHTGHTITALTESPLKAGILWAGSDDGRIHISRNGGSSWKEVTAYVPDVAPERWITCIECSHFAEGTAYLAIDRHRQDDCSPLLFKTTDYGITWHSLSENLPPGGPVHVIREDPRNRNLLFAGTEFGLLVSCDGGVRWHRLHGQEPSPSGSKSGLPTVAIHDLVVHSRDRDLVIATHGRSIYIMDIAPLEEMTDSVLAEPAHLFDVKPATAFSSRGSHDFRGGRNYKAPNPPFGAVIYYYLQKSSTETVKLSIVDATGKVVHRLKTTKDDAESGLHRIIWPLRVGSTGRTIIPAGDYAVRLQIGEYKWTKKLRVEHEE